MKAIVHHELQQTMTIHSTLPSLPENVRRLPADVVGRSSSRFATTKMTFLWWARRDGKFQKEQQRNK